jgi:hypothetical protein
MDILHVNVCRNDKKIQSYIYVKDGYIFIEKDDIFSCLSDTYNYLKRLCDKERLSINKDTVYVTLFEKNSPESITIKYNELYNLVF